MDGMKIAVAGAHGQIALLLNRLLADAGHEVVGLVRNPDHLEDVARSGAAGAVLDLETAAADEVAAALGGCQAVVFAAGAGPGSGAARKDTVDRGAAVLLADAAQRAGADRYVLISSAGVESVRGTEPSPDEEVFTTYLRAKLGAEDAVRAPDLAWTVLRPGHLTDAPGTGRVRLEPGAEDGSVPRADVAAVVAAVLAEPRSAGQVVGLVSGDTPVAEAVAALTRSA
jgi:nucleoside-diphosphate-sugar epimerase